MTEEPTIKTTVPRKSRRSRAWLTVALLILAMPLAACSTPVVSCEELPRPKAGEFNAAVTVLVPGSTAAVEETILRLTDQPDRAFVHQALGFAETTGLVRLATFDEHGTITVVAEHNLAATGTDDVRAEGGAKRGASCLRSAAAAMAPAPAPPEPPTAAAAAADPSPDLPNLLRALDRAHATLDATGAAETALVVHGLAATDNDGFRPSVADLGEASRVGVLDLLVANDLVTSADRPVVFVDPAEGVSSEIAAADLRAFTAELCAIIGPRCSVQTVLN